MNDSKKSSSEPKGCPYLIDPIYLLWNTLPIYGLTSSSNPSPHLSLRMINIHHFENPAKLSLIPKLI
jgi:hypothetical protein